MSRKSRAKSPSPFRCFNSSPEVIRLVVMMYARTFGRSTFATLLGILIILVALPLLVFAIMADQAWLDVHMLPDIMVRHWHTTWLNIERLFALVAALTLVFVLRPRLIRWAETSSIRSVLRDLFFCTAALGLAVGVAETAMRQLNWHYSAWVIGQEPLRRTNRLIGWENVPSREGVDAFNGRILHYDIDRFGHRVAKATSVLDPARPTILFVGESFMFGHRLEWSETIPGRVEAMTGVQSADLAVNAYGIDQDYLHLSYELPAFRQPLAIVMLFSPGMVEREFRANRPHLDAALHWHAPEEPWRLVQLMKVVFPFHTLSTIAYRLHTSRSVLIAADRLANSRNIPFLVLIPVFVPESVAERRIRDTVLEGSGIHSVVVALDPAWRLFRDGHPDFRGDEAMARAIVDELRRHKGLGGNPTSALPRSGYQLSSNVTAPHSNKQPALSP